MNIQFFKPQREVLGDTKQHQLFGLLSVAPQMRRKSDGKENKTQSKKFEKSRNCKVLSEIENLNLLSDKWLNMFFG